MKNRSPSGPSRLVRLAVLSSLLLAAGAALASPIMIYSRWVGDPTPDPFNANGAVFQWCDFGIQGPANGYDCMINVRESSPDGSRSLSAFYDAIGGLGSFDFDGDGRMDIMAATARNFGVGAEAAAVERLGTNVWVINNTGPVGNIGVGLGPLTTGVGFTIAPGADGAARVLYARTTNGADLVVDMRLITGLPDPITPSLTLTTVPSMTTVSRAAGANFLGFTAADMGSDGVAEMLVLHTAAAGSNTALVDEFSINGQRLSTTTLNLDPVAEARRTSAGTFEETIVGGFAFVPIISGGPKEFVVLTADRTPGAHPRSGGAGYRLWRYTSTGAFIGSFSVTSPIYSGAIPIGITGMEGDTDCDGIDDDLDGVAVPLPDNHYVPKTRSCGFGACAKTTQSSCNAGIETPAPECIAQPVSGEVLNGIDDDCNGAIDDLPVQSCTAGQQDWWCCPQGQLRFPVNAVVTDATPDVDQQDEVTAAAGCFPTGSGQSGTCNLRGAVTRAMQLRDVLGIRPQCSIVAELAPGVHELRRGVLTFNAGNLTLLGMGANQADVLVRPNAMTPSGIIAADPFSGASVALTVKNLTMKNGRAGSGGAILLLGRRAQTVDSQRLATLTIQDATFASNSSNQPGGAVHVENGAVEIHDSLFRDNNVDSYSGDGGATSRGGALYVGDSEALIDHSVFVGNAASKGGGIGAYATGPLFRGKISIANSTISRNFCGQSGCGFDSHDSDVTLAYVTIADNVLATIGATVNRLGPGLHIGHNDEEPESFKRINIFGSIIARNKGDLATAGDPATDGKSWDCNVLVNPGLWTISASNNLIGSGGQDCSLLGNPANDPLIGEGRPQGQSNPADPILDPLLRTLIETPKPNCPNPDKPHYLCQSVCEGSPSSVTCVQTTLPDSLALGKGLAATCPADDQVRYTRPPGQNCTLGAFEHYGMPSAAAQAAMIVLPRGGMNATSSSANAGEGAANAIDGNAASRFSTGTPQTPGQWFSLDMQTPRLFSQVTLDPGVASPNDYARQYQVFVSNDAVTWLGPVASGTGAAGVLSIAFPTQTARFVGVVQTGSSSSWWSVAEFNVYGPGAVPVTPLATAGWVATATHTNGSNIASRALDGNTATRWTTGVPQASGQAFQLDMLQTRTIAGLTLNSDVSNPSDYPRSFRVYATNDTANWGSPVATGTGTAQTVNVSFPQTSARHLKIVLQGSASNWWSIAELTVLGLGSFAPAPTALPRTGWIGTASPTCSSGDTPDRALDDQAGTRFSSCQNQTNGQYYQLDMLTARTFSKVTLDAGNSVGDYPRGYALYATNNTSSWGSPIATGTGSGQLISISFPSQSARYLKIVQTGSVSKWWSIHELNVYGVAPAVLPRRGWSATASLSSGVAAAGLDSNLSTRWTTNAPQANGQYFQVDMAAPQTFNQLTLNADGAASDYPRAYQVFASNNPSSFGAAIASGVASSPLVSIGFPVQNARYIRVVQTGSSSSWWSVSELNVWAPGR